MYFDGRLAEAALRLAHAAKKHGKMVLVEAERLRPNLDRLLKEADYVSTSAGFPSVSFRSSWFRVFGVLVVLGGFRRG